MENIAFNSGDAFMGGDFNPIEHQILIPLGKGKIPPNFNKKKPMELTEYEIWIGKTNPGQGMHPSTEPQLLAKVTAMDFQVACQKYEHMMALERIKYCEQTGDYYNHQDREWFYNWRNNSNSWLGKHYSSREEALTSF